MLPFVLVSAISLLMSAASGSTMPLANVEFVGNVEFEDGYYRATLLDWGFDEDDLGGQPRAQKAAARIQQLLRDNGYSLAVVRARSTGRQISFRIDEGRLAKVVFIGLGSLRTLQLQMYVDLPSDVFNKPLLEEQLRDVRQELGIRGRYEVIRETRKHDGLQLDELWEEDRGPRFELRVHLAKSRWKGGVRLHSRYGSADGLLLGASYGDDSLLFARDAWRMGLNAGVRRFAGTSNRGPRIGMSRATFDSRWFSRPFLDGKLRTFVWLDADLRIRQRPLEEVDLYRWYRGALFANLALEPSERLSLSFGIGGERRAVWDVDQPANSANPLTEDKELRAASIVVGHYVFDPENPRRDRHHFADGELRVSRTTAGNNQWIGGWAYQNIIERGWHDVQLESSGRVIYQDLQLVDEEAISRYARGVFSQDFSPRIGAASAEFRYSLSRDLLKAGVWLDAVAYQTSPYLPISTRVRTVIATGLGLHSLWLDFLQADIYYGIGRRSDGQWDHGLSASVRKAY